MLTWGRISAAALASNVDPPQHAALSEWMRRAAEAVFVTAGADATFSARLVGALKDAGPENVAGDVHAPYPPKRETCKPR